MAGQLTLDLDLGRYCRPEIRVRRLPDRPTFNAPLLRELDVALTPAPASELWARWDRPVATITTTGGWL